jgi:hypothetical protein
MTKQRPIPTPDDVLRRMLNTLPDPNVAKPKPRPEQSWPKRQKPAK